MRSSHTKRPSPQPYHDTIKVGQATKGEARKTCVKLRCIFDLLSELVGSRDVAI
jgi:hypothetical protein